MGVPSKQPEVGRGQEGQSLCGRCGGGGGAEGGRLGVMRVCFLCEGGQWGHLRGTGRGSEETAERTELTGCQQAGQWGEGLHSWGRGVTVATPQQLARQASRRRTRRAVRGWGLPGEDGDNSRGGDDVGRMTGDWSHTGRKRAAASASEGNVDSVVAGNLSGAIYHGLEVTPNLPLTLRCSRNGWAPCKEGMRVEQNGVQGPHHLCGRASPGLMC